MRPWRVKEGLSVVTMTSSRLRARCHWLLDRGVNVRFRDGFISIEVERIPLIPREVTPWFTALRAYSELGVSSMCFN